MRLHVQPRQLCKVCDASACASARATARRTSRPALVRHRQPHAGTLSTDALGTAPADSISGEHAPRLQTRRDLGSTRERALPRAARASPVTLRQRRTVSAVRLTSRRHLTVAPGTTHPPASLAPSAPHALGEAQLGISAPPSRADSSDREAAECAAISHAPTRARRAARARSSAALIAARISARLVQPHHRFTADPVLRRGVRSPAPRAERSRRPRPSRCDPLPSAVVRTPFFARSPSSRSRALFAVSDRPPSLARPILARLPSRRPPC